MALCAERQHAGARRLADRQPHQSDRADALGRRAEQPERGRRDAQPGRLAGAQRQVDLEVISAIAAWAIDHPGEKIVNAVVFPQQMKRLRETFFAERRKGVALVVRDLVSLLRDHHEQDSGFEDLHEEERKKAYGALTRLKDMGYCEHCALDAASAVLRARFGELVT